jgi:WD40 repeat protein
MPSEYEVTGIAFNHDGVAYTCCDKSPTALARSLKDGNIVAAFSAHQGSVGGIALSIDGRWLACGTDVGELSIWSTETRALVRSKKLSEHGVRALTFSDDGALVVTADGSGTIFVVEVHDPGRRLDITAGSTFPVHHAAFSADRQLLATAAWGAFHVWDLEMGNHVATLRTPGTMYDSYICFVPGSEELVLQEVGALTAWNARTGEAVPFRAEHRAAFERATNRSPREFEWEGDDHPSGVPPLPNPLTLLHSHTRRPVAFLPIMRGEMSWHRSGRIWANRRAHLLSVFTLEGQFKA